MIEFDASQVRALSADLGGATARVGKKVADATRKSGQLLLNQTESRSPVDTGELAASWAITSSGDGRSGGMSVSVRSTVRQAFFQEYGTSKMAAQPSAGPALEAVTPGYVADLERISDEILP